MHDAKQSSDLWFLLFIVLLLISWLLLCIGAHVTIISWCVDFQNNTTKNQKQNEKEQRPTRSKCISSVRVAMYLVLWCSALPLQSHLSAEPYHYRNTFLINSESIFIYFPTFYHSRVSFCCCFVFVLFSHHLNLSRAIARDSMFFSCCLSPPRQRCWSIFYVRLSSIPFHFMFIWRTLLCINVPRRALLRSFCLVVRVRCVYCWVQVRNQYSILIVLYANVSVCVLIAYTTHMHYTLHIMPYIHVTPLRLLSAYSSDLFRLRCRFFRCF